MTITHRKRGYQPDEIQTVNEPGLKIECDSCKCDLTHSIRMKCADAICEDGDGVDICPACFCTGKEFGTHKRGHAYRVIELHSYPIFEEDWGADEELLLIEGITLQGFGNWQAIAEHIGTRTKEEVEKHYHSVYIDSTSWPSPRTDVSFDIAPSEFHERKRRRISEMKSVAPPPVKIAPTSAPATHEIAGFLPGRLEFEHELDNEAEDIVKDLEFGVCYEYGGDQIIEDENDPDVLARAKWTHERLYGPSTTDTHSGKKTRPGKRPIDGLTNGITRPEPEVKIKQEPDTAIAADGKDGEEEPEEIKQPVPVESQDSLKFKLTLLEIYNQRLDRRQENKSVMFDRGLLEYKKMQAAEKKRSKEEKDIIHRLRPFSRLQTAEDFETFSTDVLYEAMLRKRIQELQHYRRMGLSTVADINKYEVDLTKRAQVRANTVVRDYYSSDRGHVRTSGGRHTAGPESRRAASISGDTDGRASHEPESSSRAGGTPSGTGPPRRKMPAPLDLANSPSLHLLTPAEQTLCSQLRIMPKAYLVIKETLVREYARRGGKLRRREARDLVKIDVNKTSLVWDFLVQAGFLKIAPIPQTVPAVNGAPSTDNAVPSTVTSSPTKDANKVAAR